MDQSLYGGVTGVGLFFAALASLTGRADFENHALAVLRPIAALGELSAPESEELFGTLGIGAGMGLGSLLYALTIAHRFLPTHALLSKAERLADSLSPALVEMDEKLDVVGGAAGAILGLLALYDQTKQSKRLEQASTCAAHLLGRRVRAGGGGPRAWRTIARAPLAGFSHGAAGIAYSLLRLYVHTNDTALREAALEGMAYERTLFSHEQQNWRDLRQQAETFPVQWCHGAAGITLARIGCNAAVKDSAIEGDIAAGLATTAAHPLQNIDQLCCGNFGRIEVLLTAGRGLKDPRLVTMAQECAGGVVDRRERTGDYCLFSNLRGTHLGIGFFQGLAGVGYELLRLASPAIVPSVLLFVSPKESHAL